MQFSSGAPAVEPLGLRRGGDRRQGDRRSDTRAGRDRRKGDRRRAGLRNLLLAAAAIAIPHELQPEALNVWLLPPVPTVTTSIDSMFAVPAPRAYDALILE